MVTPVKAIRVGVGLQKHYSIEKRKMDREELKIKNRIRQRDPQKRNKAPV